MNNSVISSLSFQFNSDERGELVIIESDQIIPFKIKRLFYMYKIQNNTVRGKHANINSEFVMVALSGSVKVRIHNGKVSEERLLDNPKVGIYIPKMTWKEMYDFSSDCILLVISNCLYDKSEYIREYERFMELANEKD